MKGYFFVYKSPVFNIVSIGIGDVRLECFGDLYKNDVLTEGSSNSLWNHFEFSLVINIYGTVKTQVWKFGLYIEVK